jgi:two-component system NtrC family sensor kinase
MHRLLQRQLKRYLADVDLSTPQWQDFLKAVDNAYCQYDNDHDMIERSLEISSDELLQANSQLRDLLTTVEAQVAQRTSELTTANRELESTLADLKKAQSNLIQAEKMSSLGQLVAGIAHEINNPVNFIHGNLTYLRRYIQELMTFIEIVLECQPELTEVVADKLEEEIDLEFVQTDLPKLIKSMEVGTSRIRNIVLSLRNFSHMDEAELKFVDIHQGIDDTLLILAHRLKFQFSLYEIQVIKDYGNLPLVNCYGGQLNQVLINVLANAIDALEESVQKIDPPYPSCPCHQPYIKIETRLINLGWVQIKISDNGLGMPEEIQSQIFDPFFTTKPVGKGTGMGMAISYQIIVEKHKGYLEFTSVPHQGTEFVIKIPINCADIQPI